MAQTLEDRIARLEDIQAISDLTARYAYHVNKGWNDRTVQPATLDDIFTDDASWKCAAMQVDVSGKSQVIDMLANSMTDIKFAQHSFTNPLIDVSGDRATGNWLIWVAVDRGDGVQEVFQDEDLVYVRTAQGWRIQSIDLHFGTIGTSA